MIRVLALDPAAAGAAVLLEQQDGRTAVRSAWAWKAVQRGGRRAWLLHSWAPGVVEVIDEALCRTPGEMGWRIGDACVEIRPDRLMVEAAYIGVNGSTALRIARLGGIVVGGIQAAIGVSAEEIRPSEWRRAIDVGGRNREQCKALSLHRVPLLVPAIRPVLEALGPLDHLTDATGIGLAAIRLGPGGRT